MTKPALPERVRRALAALAERVRARYGPRVRAVRLYGSFVRGEARSDSDVDVFVLIDDLSDAERRALFDLSAEIGLLCLVSLQVFAPGPAEHRWLVESECRILRDVEAEGIAA